MAGGFAKLSFGARRPDVVISRRAIQSIGNALPNAPQTGPLGFGLRIVAAFDAIAHVDDEGGLRRLDFAPNLLVDAIVGAPGAVPHDCEMKIVVRWRKGQRSQ